MVSFLLCCFFNHTSDSSQWRTPLRWFFKTTVGFFRPTDPILPSRPAWEPCSQACTESGACLLPLASAESPGDSRCLILPVYFFNFFFFTRLLCHLSNIRCCMCVCVKSKKKKPTRSMTCTLTIICLFWSVALRASDKCGKRRKR